jgi:class 3 adenylate cyclase
VTARDLHQALEASDPSDLSGVTLASGAIRGPRSSTMTLPAARHERRPVTALACVFKAAALSARTGELEEFDEILQQAMAACAEIGRRYGGVTAAVLGQTLLMYYGCPRAEEDDARRAARAALAIARATATTNEGLASRGIRVDVGIGIHTDFVVAAQIPGLGSTSLVTGTTPQIASEIAAGAASGSILLTAPSRALLEATWEIDEADVRSVPGPPRTIAVSRLVAERDARTPSPGSDDPRAPIVGRDRDVDLLLERWRRAREGTKLVRVPSWTEGRERSAGKTRSVAW